MVISELKKLLISNPDNIVQLLDKYNYCNIKVHSNYISCGRSQDSSPKAIVVKTENNDYVWLKDYPQNKSQEIISYIMEERGVDFKTVLRSIQTILGIADCATHFKPKTAFGGFYDRIKSKSGMTQVKTYDESYLDKFEQIGNARFLKDHISLQAQAHFGIRFDIEDNGIVIPIRDEIGSLMGVKIRCNYDSQSETFQKYWFYLPAMESQTLYGYYDNYSELTNGTVYVFEAEKGVMQAWSYGCKNAVGLGSGSISAKQVQLILQLNPRKVVFLHDQGYSFDAIRRNMKMLNDYSKFADMDIEYWDWSMQTKGESWDSKMSPTDKGKDVFEYIINAQLKDMGELAEVEQ